MAKSKINRITTLLVMAGVVWFLIISFITAQTEYQHIVADWLADPKGISTRLESILNILIILISFMPSGFLFAYPYIVKNFSDNRLLRLIVLSLILAFVLTIPFSWYNFYVNFGR